MSHTFIGRAIQAVAQDPLALRLMAADPSRIKRIAFGLSIASASVAGAILIIIQPVEPSIARDYIGRIFAICVMGGLGSFAGTVVGGDDAGHRREPHRHLLWSVVVAGGGVRFPAADAGGPAGRIVRAALMANIRFVLLAAGRCRCGFRRRLAVDNAYLYFAGYVVLQYIVLATAWNILGGYTGYVNFGIAAFFALGRLYHGRAAQDCPDCRCR